MYCSHRNVMVSTPTRTKRDPIWTPGCWTGPEDSSNTEEEINYKQEDVITKYNQGIEYLSAAGGVENPLPLTHQTFDWETASEKEKNVCIDRASEACRLVCNVITPNNGEELLNSLPKKVNPQLVQPSSLFESHNKELKNTDF